MQKTRTRFRQADELGRYMEDEYTLTSQEPVPPLNNSDVLIATYPKCGTTLIQHLIYMLISDGDTSFHEIGRVSPFLDYFRRNRQNLQFESVYTPHLLKTHLLPADLPVDKRVICCFRNPGDVAVSLYHFFTNWYLDPQHLTLDDFVQIYFCSPTSKGTNYWGHLLAWKTQCQRGKALALAYENLLKDKNFAIQKICNYLGLVCNDETVETAKYYTSFAWMKKNEEKFNELDFRQHCEFIDSADIPYLTTKVRAGKVGSSLEELSDASLNLLDKCWRTRVTPTTGWNSYQDFLKEIDELPVPD